MTGKFFFRAALVAAVLVSALSASTWAMDGVCVDSPQTDCSLYYNPPSAPSYNNYSPPSYNNWLAPTPSYEPPQPTAAERKATAANKKGQDFLNKGNAALSKGDFRKALKIYDQAIREFKLAIEANPGKQIYWDNLKTMEGLKASVQGSLFLGQRKLANSAIEYKRALKLWPPHVQGYADMKENVRRADQLLAADQAYTEGESLVKYRKYGEAIKMLRKAVSLAPDGFEPEKSNYRRLLAEAEAGQKADKEIRTADRFLQQGKAEQASIYYERALRASPDDKVASAGLRDAERMMAGEVAEQKQESGSKASRQLDSSSESVRDAARSSYDSERASARSSFGEDSRTGGKQREVQGADDDVARYSAEVKNATSERERVIAERKLQEAKRAQILGEKEEKTASGGKQSAMQQLISADKSQKKGSGRPYDNEAEYAEARSNDPKPLGRDIGQRLQPTPLQREIESLPPAQRAQLTGDREFKKWQQEWKEADKALPKAAQKVEEKKKVYDAEQDFRKKSQLQIELGELENEQRRLESTKKAAEVNLEGKVKEIKNLGNKLVE